MHWSNAFIPEYSELVYNASLRRAVVDLYLLDE
jgi:hypothetical protein